MNQKITRLTGDYLTYNRTEQRGILVLCIILLCGIMANAIIPSGTSISSPDFSKFSQEIASFKVAWQKAADSDSLARLQKYHNYKFKGGMSFGDSIHLKTVLPKPIVLVELNSADTFELQQLRGIGPGFARRIVNYRERLRGYCDKRQVLEIFGMDTARYRMIEENLRVNSDSIHPYDINTATFKEMLHHPYFPFAITKNIMLYRQKNKTFKSLQELRKIEGINDSIFGRMVVYLRLGP
ncbi:MAG: ComEA family DNA-binding protein [Bacteroidales bacterium]